MKRLIRVALVCLIAGPPIAGCASAAAPTPPAAAVLTASTEQCRTKLNDAARVLLGRKLTLAADAFTQNDAAVLSTLGQSASGRMLPPKDILRLQLAPAGCQLRLDGRDRVVALPPCSCRAVSGSN